MKIQKKTHNIYFTFIFCAKKGGIGKNASSKLFFLF